MHGLHMSAMAGLKRVLSGKIFASHSWETGDASFARAHSLRTESWRLLGSLRWCHTDLGANALNWPRLVREDRRLSSPGSGPDGMADDHNDGLLAQALLDAGMSRDATAHCLHGLGSSPVDWQELLRHLLTL